MMPLNALLRAAVALTGCGTMYSGKPHLNAVNELLSDELVLVGRIELVPPLTADEQELKTLTSDRFQGKASALFADRAYDLDDLPISAGSDAIMVELGRDFYTRQPKSKSMLYSGALILTRSAGATTPSRSINCSFRVDCSMR